LNCYSSRKTHFPTSSGNHQGGAVQPIDSSLTLAPSVMRLFPWRPNAATAVFVGLLAALAFLNLHRVSEFLYFKY